MKNPNRCAFCGSDSYGTGCPISPDGLHDHPYDPSSCRFCGSKERGGPCPYGPSALHLFGAGEGKCVLCGSTEIDTPCRHNPHGFQGSHDMVGSHIGVVDPPNPTGKLLAPFLQSDDGKGALRAVKRIRDEGEKSRAAAFLVEALPAGNDAVEQMLAEDAAKWRDPLDRARFLTAHATRRLSLGDRKGAVKMYRAARKLSGGAGPERDGEAGEVLCSIALGWASLGEVHLAKSTAGEIFGIEGIHDAYRRIASLLIARGQTTTGSRIAFQLIGHHARAVYSQLLAAHIAAGEREETLELLGIMKNLGMTGETVLGLAWLFEERAKHGPVNPDLEFPVSPFRMADKLANAVSAPHVATPLIRGLVAMIASEGADGEPRERLMEDLKSNFLGGEWHTQRERSARIALVVDALACCTPFLEREILLAEIRLLAIDLDSECEEDEEDPSSGFGRTLPFARLAAAHAALGDCDRALEHLGFIEYHPPGDPRHDNPQILERAIGEVALSFARASRYEEALAVMERMQIMPDPFSEGGDRDGDFGRYLRSPVERSIAWWNLAIAFAKAGRGDAKKLFDKACFRLHFQRCYSHEQHREDVAPAMDWFALARLPGIMRRNRERDPEKWENLRLKHEEIRWRDFQELVTKLALSGETTAASRLYFTLLGYIWKNRERGSVSTRSAHDALEVARAVMAIPGTEELVKKICTVVWELVDRTPEKSAEITGAYAIIRFMSEQGLWEQEEIEEKIRRYLPERRFLEV